MTSIPYTADAARPVPTPTPDTVYGVIVTFHPDDDFPHRVEAALAQLAGVVIVDNGSRPVACDMLETLSRRTGVRVIYNATNRGIATALNQGMAEAARLGYPWVLLMDQDTVPLEVMVAILGRAYDECPVRDTVALIGSNFIEASTQRPAYDVPGDGRVWVECRAVITSGSLVSTAVFQVVGSFRDEFFIDEVDIDYCLRARARGYRVIMTRAPVAVHAIGAAHPKRFLWTDVRPSNHNAVRWYYMTRNRVVLAREYWRAEPAWTMHSLFSHLKAFIKVLLYERARMEKVRQATLGAWHGVRGRLGERQPRGAQRDPSTTMSGHG